MDAAWLYRRPAKEGPPSPSSIGSQQCQRSKAREASARLSMHFSDRHRGARGSRKGLPALINFDIPDVDDYCIAAVAPRAVMPWHRLQIALEDTVIIQIEQAMARNCRAARFPASRPTSYKSPAALGARRPACAPGHAVPRPSDAPEATRHDGAAPIPPGTARHRLHPSLERAAR